MCMSVNESNKTQRSMQAVQLSIIDLRKQVSGGSGCNRVTLGKKTVVVSLLTLGILAVGLLLYFVLALPKL